MKTKVCIACGEDKPLSPEHYNRDPKGGKGYNARCKECRSSYRRKLRVARMEKRKRAIITIDNLDHRDEEKVGQIYFIVCAPYGVPHFVKIGWSENIRKRIKSFKTGNPFSLRLLASFTGTMQDEREIQRELLDYKLPNRDEWFCLAPVLEYLKETGSVRLTAYGEQLISS